MIGSDTFVRGAGATTIMAPTIDGIYGAMSFIVPAPAHRYQNANQSINAKEARNQTQILDQRDRSDYKRPSNAKPMCKTVTFLGITGHLRRNMHSGRGKPTRLKFLLKLLNLEERDVGEIGYQLLHRTASAVLEARRYGARHAVMLVHSFSQSMEHFDDFAAFVDLFGHTGTPNQVTQEISLANTRLHLGWVVGDAEYLTR